VLTKSPPFMTERYVVYFMTLPLAKVTYRRRYDYDRKTEALRKILTQCHIVHHKSQTDFLRQQLQCVLHAHPLDFSRLITSKTVKYMVNPTFSSSCYFLSLTSSSCTQSSQQCAQMSSIPAFHLRQQIKF
jgi:hypothetical protein